MHTQYLINERWNGTLKNETKRKRGAEYKKRWQNKYYYAEDIYPV